MEIAMQMEITIEIQMQIQIQIQIDIELAIQYLELLGTLARWARALGLAIESNDTEILNYFFAVTMNATTTSGWRRRQRSQRRVIIITTRTGGENEDEKETETETSSEVVLIVVLGVGVLVVVLVVVVWQGVGAEAGVVQDDAAQAPCGVRVPPLFAFFKQPRWVYNSFSWLNIYRENQ